MTDEPTRERPRKGSSMSDEKVFYDCETEDCENPMCWEHALQYGPDA